MELILKRTAFGALVAAAVLLPSRKPATLVAAEATNDRSARYDTLAWKYRAAQNSWIAFDLNDSAVAVMAGMKRVAGRPEILWRGFGGLAPSTVADSLVDARWKELGALHANARVAIMVYNAQPYKATPYEGALVTRDGDQIDCVAIAPGHRASSGQASVWEYEFDKSISPCLLVAAFGPPGRGVGDWLAATRYASAQSNQWLQSSRASTAGRFAAPWVEWLNSAPRDNWFNGVPRWVNTIGALEVGTGTMLPYEMGGAALHCIAGEEAACVTGVLHPALDFPLPDAMPVELTQDVTRSSRALTTVESVRPPQRAFVSALITTFGREKFQRFWSSDLPLEQAFQAAFGESLGHWTARWSHDAWSNSVEARYMAADITLGVTLKPSWLLAAAVWSALGLAIAGAVARRRTAA